MDSVKMIVIEVCMQKNFTFMFILFNQMFIDDRSRKIDACNNACNDQNDYCDKHKGICDCLPGYAKDSNGHCRCIEGPLLLINYYFIHMHSQ